MSAAVEAHPLDVQRSESFRVEFEGDVAVVVRSSDRDRVAYSAPTMAGRAWVLEAVALWNIALDSRRKEAMP